MKVQINDNQTFIDWCLKTKYASHGESTSSEIFARVASGLGDSAEEESRFRDAMEAGFIPGGRIMSSAGTSRQTTLINCFVQPVADTVSGYDDNGYPGIFVALQESAETMRRGGGVGYDFSPIRPRGARVKGTDSRASGPVSYMVVFDRMCQTVESAGARRGAQMGILRIDHPDIEEFINAKVVPSLASMGLNASQQESLASVMSENAGFAYSFRNAFARLSNFNLSVTVTDDFMKALESGDEFDLVHQAEPGHGHLGTKIVDGKTVYIYRRVNARSLWDLIMRNNYEFAEPGVIFIDRVNKLNNLRYAEQIHASNPCGEQMLPAYGCCDLGSPDLGRFVKNPYSDHASFDMEGLDQVVRTGVEILDRVLDKTHWPLPAQVAPFIDSAISKTINVPQSYSFEDFSEVYLKAYRLGLKGITTYRPNANLNAVLVSTKPQEETQQTPVPVDEPSRQVAMQPIAPSVSEALSRSRPKTPKGVDGRCYQIKHAAGDFAVMVTHSDDEKAPLDVYVASAEQPRGIAAVAMVLSLDLRAMDPGWTTMKLDSLSRTKGDDAFDLVHPATGDQVRAPSLVAGFTMVVRQRLQELGVLEPTVPSPMMDSLFSSKEPKAGPEGGKSWHVDICNPSTGDDFVMFVKEQLMPDGSRRPFSVWLVGEIPSVLVGLTKLLSIDMRVSDPQWVIKKLRKLVAFGENRGDFFAVVPGEKRQKNYPSTVAYLAAVLLHRYESLGLIASEDLAQQTQKTGAGKLCPSCKTPSLHKRDGCEVCDACGHTGSCG